MTCNCRECTQRRLNAANLRAIKAEFPAPEYDWNDLEQQDQRSRTTPEWYKKVRLP